MFIGKASLLIVMLVIPNTTWKDWQTSTNPALKNLIQTAAIGEMMPRTAERKTISCAAEIRTMVSGARMDASADTSGLDYPVRPTNLTDALMANECQININTGVVNMTAPQRYDPQGNWFRMETLNVSFNSSQASNEIDGLRRMMEKSKAHCTLIVVSGCPSPNEYANHERLCPIAFWQPGIQPGYLTSPSTRTQGLIANTDIAPTIAHLAGIDKLPGPVYGNPFHAEPDSPSDAAQKLTNIADSAQDQEIEQEKVPYFALVLSGCLVFFGWAAIVKSNTSTKTGIVVVAYWTPLILLAFGHLFDGIWLAVFWTFFWLGVRQIGIGIYSTKSRSISPAWYFLCLLALASCDAIFNHSLILARSLMGYSYQEGARYYGLGNEAMGAMVGFAAAGTAGLWTEKIKRGRLISVLIWLALAAEFAIPTIGAKAGGVLVVGVALAGYLIVTRPNPDKPLSIRAKAAILILGLGLGLGALVFSAGSGESHVSETLAQVRQFGLSTLTSLVFRKLAMDISLMFHSAWMLVLIVSVAVQVSFLRHTIISPDIKEKVGTVWKLGLIATLACLVLNDAGVVAAALCSLSPLAMISGLSLTAFDVRRSGPSLDTKPGQQPA